MKCSQCGRKNPETIYISESGKIVLCGECISKLKTTRIGVRQ